jgi:CRISPR-associated protein Csb1
MDFTELKKSPRLLITAELQPLQGTRFQPTGFPDLGAATYQLPKSKTKMLLLESAQSVANRLEMTIWDEVKQGLVTPFQGIPYVVVKRKSDKKVLTNSLLEAHRLNSIYIIGGKKNQFVEILTKELEYSKDLAVDFHKLSLTIAKYDINGLIHGVFLEQIGGRCRIARALSGFIEANGIEVVASGGVKNDRVRPSKDKGKDGGESRQGNVPFARDEYTAEKITAYFSLDLRQVLGYRLGSDTEDLLIAMSLYKILSFLDTGLRLRTACDLECVNSIVVDRPHGFIIPSLSEITESLPDLIRRSSSVFANPVITEVEYEPGKNSKPKGGNDSEETDEGDNE